MGCWPWNDAQATLYNGSWAWCRIGAVIYKGHFLLVRKCILSGDHTVGLVATQTVLSIFRQKELAIFVQFRQSVSSILSHF